MFVTQKSYPTYLFFNPFPVSKTIELNVGDQKSDIYDLIHHSFIRKNIKGKVSVVIPGDQAMVLVYTGAGEKAGVKNGMLEVGGVIVDYGYQQ
ncbi:MAG: hypothetical protein IPO25_02590 [Saprospiraceae bacterium]|nr:hypothetical protein [Saprospiraceae bacterium]